MARTRSQPKSSPKLQKSSFKRAVKKQKVRKNSSRAVEMQSKVKKNPNEDLLRLCRSFSIRLTRCDENINETGTYLETIYKYFFSLISSKILTNSIYRTILYSSIHFSSF